jgi:hypothetical protein
MEAENRKEGLNGNKFTEQNRLTGKELEGIG